MLNVISRPLHRPHLRLTFLAALCFGLLLSGCVSLTPYPQIVDSLPDEELITVAGERVHVVQRGVGEAVVFLHGFGASAWSWREVTPRVAEGYRTVAVDLFGFGWTERTERLAAYTQQGQIGLVLGVMDELGIERAHLVGHSYGGAIAQALAVRYPERLHSLVLVNSARADYPLARRKRLGGIGPINTLFLRTLGLSSRAVRSALENSVADDWLVTDEMVRAYRDRLAIRGAGRAYTGLTRPGLDPETIIVDLADIPVPTLVVWGEQDTLIPIGPARERSREIPDSRFIALPDVGHLPMEEVPERLAREIKDFLDELDRSRDPR